MSNRGGKHRSRGLLDSLVDYLVPVGLDLGVRDILKVLITAKSERS